MINEVKKTRSERNRERREIISEETFSENEELLQPESEPFFQISLNNLNDLGFDEDEDEVLNKDEEKEYEEYEENEELVKKNIKDFEREKTMDEKKKEIEEEANEKKMRKERDAQANDKAYGLSEKENNRAIYEKLQQEEFEKNKKQTEEKSFFKGRSSISPKISPDRELSSAGESNLIRDSERTSQLTQNEKIASDYRGVNGVLPESISLKDIKGMKSRFSGFGSVKTKGEALGKIIWLFLILSLIIGVLIGNSFGGKGGSVGNSDLRTDTALASFVEEYTQSLYSFSGVQKKWTEEHRNFVKTHTLDNKESQPLYDIKSAEIINDTVDIKDIVKVEDVLELQNINKNVIVVGTNNSNNLPTKVDEATEEVDLEKEKEKDATSTFEEEVIDGDKKNIDFVTDGEDGKPINIDVDFYKVKVTFKSKIVSLSDETKRSWRSVNYLIAKVQDKGSESGFSFFVLTRNQTELENVEPLIEKNETKYLENFMKEIYPKSGKEVSDKSTTDVAKANIETFLNLYAKDREAARMTMNNKKKLPMLTMPGQFKTSELKIKMYETEIENKFEVYISVPHSRDEFGYTDIKYYKVSYVGTSIIDLQEIWTDNT